MRYLWSAIVFLAFIIILLSGCGGGHSSSVGPVTSITLTPMPTISLNFGDFIQMSATATDARGNTVLNQTITFSSDNNNVQIASNGMLCAGTWTLSSSGAPLMCNVPQNPVATTANITAKNQNVTSNTVVVNVHARVASLQLTASQSTCVSQGGPIVYTAHAFDINHQPIADADIGTLTWSIVDSTIGTLSTTSTGTANTVTAALPGVTTVTASVNATNPVTSNAVVFQECAVGSITITGPDTTPANQFLAFSPSPANVGDTGQLSATVTDTIGGAVSGVTLTWNTSQPSIASVNSSGLATAAAAGTSSITASCALGTSCNKNQGTLVTSNTVVANVGGSATTFVYAAGNGTNNSFVSIDPANGNAVNAIDLGDAPNSLVLDAPGNNAYLGTPSGLKVVSTSANPPTLSRTISNAVGRVLAVSPNGTFVLLAGTSGNVLVYNTSTNTVSTFNVPAPTMSANIAASYSPDSTEAVVVSDGGAAKVYTIQGGVLRTLSFTLASAATDVRFTADGLFIYLANSTTPFLAACNNALQAPSTALPMTRLLPIIDPNNPGKTKMLGTSSPNITVIAPGVTPGNTSCPPMFTEPRAQVSLGGAFTANQIFATPDGRHAYITAGDVAGRLLTYNAVTNTPGSVPLTGGTASTTTGGATADGAFVYVGANDNSVHIIDANAGTDTAQVAITDVNGNPFVPNLVAVRPH